MGAKPFPGVRDLAASRGSLSPRRLLAAVRLARALGRAFAEAAADEAVMQRARRRDLPPVRPDAYLELLLRPLSRRGMVPASSVKRWEEAFAKGPAPTDPRVQAFTSGCGERTLEIALSTGPLGLTKEGEDRSRSLPGLPAG